MKKRPMGVLVVCRWCKKTFRGFPTGMCTHCGRFQ